jgi:hypothetical protein
VLARATLRSPFGAVLIALALLIGLPAVADAKPAKAKATTTLADEQPDFDGDGIPDAIDNCLSYWNADQADGDNDGIGDACDEAPPPDQDGDGAPDDTDNCLTYFNPEQGDIDGDGLGDSCDENPYGPNGPPGGGGDSDGDGYTDVTDNCPSAFNPAQEDIDNDGTGDACDPFDDRDADQDGVLDTQDNCPTVANSDQGDVDQDGIGTACDTRERPRSAADCNKTGWKAFNGRYTFRNQGECLKQVPKPKSSR